jgi:hypothetical protein
VISFHLVLEYAEGGTLKQFTNGTCRLTEDSIKNLI